VTKHLDWIFAGLAVAAGYGLVRALRCEPVIRPGDSLFLFGDSLAVGLDPFFRKLAAENRNVYASSSKGGTMMRYWLQNSVFKANLQQAKPNVVLVSLGTNDTYSNLTAEQLRQDAEAILQLAQGSEKRKVLWILPPRLPREDRASPAIRDTGVDAYESSRLEIPMGGDAIHPTSSGYAMWAAMVWRYATCAASEPSRGVSGVPSRGPAVRPAWLRPVSSASVTAVHRAPLALAKNLR
jgi:lysophospholipase L1-like esterase